jgi:hypothetical protein
VTERTCRINPGRYRKSADPLIGPVRQRTMLSRAARFAERAASRRAQYPAIQDA